MEYCKTETNRDVLNEYIATKPVPLLEEILKHTNQHKHITENAPIINGILYLSFFNFDIEIHQ